MGNGVPMAAKDLVFLDTETSGTDPDVHEVIELAAVRTAYDTHTERGGVERRIRMDRPEVAEAKALEVNHYSPAAWADAVPARMAYVELASLLGADDEVIVVGHNVTFDLDMIRAGAKRAGVALARPRVLDTMSICWPLHLKGTVPSMKLDAICKVYDISNAGAHSAMVDVRRVIALYRAMLRIKPPAPSPAVDIFAL